MLTPRRSFNNSGTTWVAVKCLPKECPAGQRPIDMSDASPRLSKVTLIAARFPPGPHLYSFITRLHIAKIYALAPVCFVIHPGLPGRRPAPVDNCDQQGLLNLRGNRFVCSLLRKYGRPGLVRAH